MLRQIMSKFNVPFEENVSSELLVRCNGGPVHALTSEELYHFEHWEHASLSRDDIMRADFRERLKGIDGKGMISKCGWEMKKKQCVYGFSLFSQELCQRATWLSEFLLSTVLLHFSGRAFWSSFGFFIVGAFSRHVSKGVWSYECWLFGQSLVCHFPENSTPASFCPL